MNFDEVLYLLDWQKLYAKKIIRTLVSRKQAMKIRATRHEILDKHVRACLVAAWLGLV